MNYGKRNFTSKTQNNNNNNNCNNYNNDNYYTIENTEKSPGDLRRFAVTQTPVKGSQGVNDNNLTRIT